MALPSGGVDTNDLGCQGLGGDYGDSGYTEFTASDFRVKIVNRSQLIIYTNSPNKTLLETGGPTLGEIFGTGGCLISDNNITDNDATWDKPNESMFGLDYISTNPQYDSQTGSKEKYLGEVNPNSINSIELTWVIRVEDRTGSDRFAFLDSRGWRRDDGADVTDNGTGLIITQIENKENINITLKVEEQGNNVRLVTVDDRVTFTQGSLNGKIAFFADLQDVSKDFILLPDNLTIDDLRTGSDFVELEYFNDVNDSQGLIKIWPASTQQQNETLLEEAGNGGGSTGGSATESCESKGGAFSFIICPALEALGDGFQWFDARIEEALVVNTDYIENDSTVRVWRNFRNIAYILLIPIMLVMVIGTALNFSFFDAYTVKRAMPRLLAAIIFISLSYNITLLMVEVTNVVGVGTKGLIASPFGDLSLESIFATPKGFTDNAVYPLTIFAGVGIAALSGVTIGGLLLTVGLGVLALLLIFILLYLRELLITFLVVMSPIAIIAWIFPGNDKPWKFWWQAFSKMLYFFPIVIAVITFGKAFASIVSDVTGDEGGIIATMIKIIAYVGPYFFIPKLFSLAGGALGSIAGMANDRTKGVFDRGRKKRSEMSAVARQKNRNYSRFSDKNALGRGLNTVLGSNSSWNGVKSTMRGRSGIAAAIDSGRRIQGMENLKNDPHWAEIENNDAALLALADMETAEKKLQEARNSGASAEEIANREKAIALAKQVNTRDTVATRRAAFNQLAKTGYQFRAGRDGYDELASIAAGLSGGTYDKTANGGKGGLVGGDLGLYANTMNEAQYHLKNAGRFDLAGINNGGGFSLDKGVGKASLYALANGKTDSLTAWGQELAYKDGPFTDKEQHQAMVQYKELQSMLPSATGGNRDEIIKQLQALETHGVKQWMSQPTGNTTQQERKINYNRDTASSDPSYAARFSPEEVARGYKIETVSVNETRGEIAQREARAYQQPDPNNLEN